MRKKISLACAIVLLSPLAASAATTYAYDDLGRLYTASYDNGKTITYNFDPAGNRSGVQTANTPHAALVKKSGSRMKAAKSKRH